MRVLMLCTPVPDRLRSLLPLAAALRAAGHELTLLCQPDLIEMATTRGIEHVVIGERFHVCELRLIGVPPGIRPAEAHGAPGEQELRSEAQLWRNHSAYMLPEYLEFARDYRPDLIVAEQLEFTSLMIGGVLGVPVVQQRWGVDAYSGSAVKFARVFLRPLCLRLGLSGLPEPDVLLDPCPADLQLSGGREGTAVRLFEGEHQPGNDICIALSEHSYGIHCAELLPTLLAAAEQPAMAPRITEPDALSGAAIVVHDGDAVATMAAVAAGVPQLVLPQWGDQFVTAAQVQAAGIGLAVTDPAIHRDAGALRAIMANLLTDKSFLLASSALRREWERLPALAETVGALR